MTRDEPGDTYWGSRAFAFVDAVEATKSPDQVALLFEKEIAQAGFSAYVMCGLPDAQTNFRDRILANGWPAEWSSIYLREDLAPHDPVERHCLRSVEPFDWREAPMTRRLSRAPTWSCSGPRISTWPRGFVFPSTTAKGLAPP
jgi:LuxR family transcriptional regulator, quorum-sensing system regulator BjaR1